MAPTAVWSAAKGWGAVMDHLPESSFLTTVVSPSRWRISICLMSASFISRIFGAALGSGLPALASSERFDQYSNPPSPARTAAAINKRANFMAVSSLAPFPPHAHAHDDNRQRQQDYALIEQHACLARIHVQPPILGILGPDRDQVLIRAQPVEHVHVQVAVSVE